MMSHVFTSVEKSQKIKKFKTASKPLLCHHTHSLGLYFHASDGGLSIYSTLDRISSGNHGNSLFLWGDEETSKLAGADSAEHSSKPWYMEDLDLEAESETDAVLRGACKVAINCKCRLEDCWSRTEGNGSSSLGASCMSVFPNDFPAIG
jgi:hypothetical protein